MRPRDFWWLLAADTPKPDKPVPGKLMSAERERLLRIAED